MARGTLDDSRKRLAARASSAVQGFIELVLKLQTDTLDSPSKYCNTAIKASGLYGMYQNETGEKAQARIENLDELVTACEQFDAPDEAENLTLLDAFLAHASLEAGELQADQYQDAVQMMTIHTAKGLEFPLFCWRVLRKVCSIV